MIKHSLIRLLLAGGLVGCATSAGAQKINISRNIDESVKPDIVYFQFDEVDGRIVPDSGVSGLDGTLEPGADEKLPKEVAGPTIYAKKALNFNYGTPESCLRPPSNVIGGRVAVGASPALDLLDTSFTMGAWVFVTPPESVLSEELAGEVGVKYIASKGGATASSPGWGFCLWYDGRKNVWSLAFQSASDDGQQGMVRADLKNFAPQLWQHVAVTFDASSRELVLYLNGVDVHRGEILFNPGIAPQPLSVGERSVPQFGNFSLSLDEFFITSGVHEFVAD